MADTSQNDRAQRARVLDAAAVAAPTLAGGQWLAAEAAELRRTPTPRGTRPMLKLPVFRN